MNNDFVSFPITGISRLKEKMLNWADQFNICSFLDNHRYHFGHHTYECLAGAGAGDIIACSDADALDRFDAFRRRHPGWLFGHLNYDLATIPVQPSPGKPGTDAKGGEGTDARAEFQTKASYLNFPDLFFFVPEVVLLLSDTELAIASYGPLSPIQVFERIQAIELPPRRATNLELRTSAPGLPTPGSRLPAIGIQARFSKEEYIETVERLRAHILRGDCYEINFCQEFYAEGVRPDPLAVYRSLSAASPNPFGGYYKLEDQYLFCASPERYLKKEGEILLSQPIKGTWKREPADKGLDEHNRRQLYESSKDRSENVMVVDLVRNDLSRICREGTVTVDELFGIYSFPQVHQMISTVSGRLREGLGFSDIIRACFPMGSMTGAPKKRVMELIARYERSRRGLFSGALGYMEPGGDFDFNVVIRSILYNRASGYLSYQVGSGITFYSEAEQEYEECLLKAEAIRRVLSQESGVGSPESH